jgi:hypothetical protein
MHPLLPLGAVALTAGCVFVAVPITAATPEYSTDANSMDEFAESGERMVTDYLTQIGLAGDSLPSLSFIPSAGTTASQCVDVNGYDTQNDRSWNYCPTDNTVYIGQNSLWDAYRQYGATAPISGIAHEYGHFLQSVMGVPNPGSAAETIRHENQADCFSGAFIGYLHDRGGVESPRDVDGVEQYLTATASVEAPGRDHGTAPERIESFQSGFTGGLSACNRFFPAMPLTG